MTQWKPIDGAFVARLPGLRLGVFPSHKRFPCSRRWGWIVCDAKTGKVIAKSRLTRYRVHGLAMAGGLRWVRQYRPHVWEAAHDH